MIAIKYIDGNVSVRRCQFLVGNWKTCWMFFFAVCFYNPWVSQLKNLTNSQDLGSFLLGYAYRWTWRKQRHKRLQSCKEHYRKCMPKHWLQMLSLWRHENLVNLLLAKQLRLPKKCLVMLKFLMPKWRSLQRRRRNLRFLTLTILSVFFTVIETVCC